jgi:hypothetical protein
LVHFQDPISHRRDPQPTFSGSGCGTTAATLRSLRSLRSSRCTVRCTWSRRQRAVPGGQTVAASAVAAIPQLLVFNEMNIYEYLIRLWM